MSVSSLKRSMTPFDTIMLCVGAIIGSGAFLLPGNLFISQAGVLNTVIGMMLGVCFILLIEKSYSFFIKRDSSAGGEFTFTLKALGKNHAFICGWFLVLAYICLVPFNIIALVKISRVLFPGVLDKGYLYAVEGYQVYLLEALVASGILIFFAFANIQGLKLASKIQSYMSLILVSVVFTSGTLFFLSPSFSPTIFNSHFDLSHLNLSNILKIISIAPFAFIGFDCVTQVTEELDYEAKKASKMVVFSLVIGFLLYNLLNFMTAAVYNAQMLQNDSVSWATGQASFILYGLIGKYAIALALLMAITAGVNGFYIAASRLLFAMARTKALPKVFDKTNKNSIPHIAVLFILTVSLIAPWLGDKALGWMIDMTSVGATVGYLYTCISAYKVAKSEGRNLQVKFSFIGIIVSAVFIALLLLPSSSQISFPAYFAIIVWSCLGVTFFYINKENYLSLNQDVELVE